MKTIYKKLVGSTEGAIDAQIKAYELCYPYMGYGTRVSNKRQEEDGFWYADAERQSSCD